MTIEQFAYFIYWSGDNREPHERLGQRLFNELLEYHDEIAEEIRGTDCDPFYDDARVPAFLKRVLDFVEV